MDAIARAVHRVQKRLLFHAATAFLALVAAVFGLHALYIRLSHLYGEATASIVFSIAFALAALLMYLSPKLASRSIHRRAPHTRPPSIGTPQLTEAFMTGLKIANPDYRRK